MKRNRFPFRAARLLAFWLLPPVLVLGAFASAACSGPTSGTTSGKSTLFSPAQAAEYGFTHQQADGNRFAPGKGDLLRTKPIDIPLGGEPRWLVAAPDGNTVVFAAVLRDGRVKAFRATGQGVERTIAEIPISPKRLPREAPPLLTVSKGKPQLIPSPPDASRLSHPVQAGPGSWAYVAKNGDLSVSSTVFGKQEEVRLKLALPPDARLLADGTGRLLLLTEATRRYPHGALGDKVEAGGAAVVDARDGGNGVRVLAQISLPDAAVVEGLAPIWADMNNDGTREIVLTVSDARQGARIEVYDEVGRFLASGPAPGQGNRWRHQIAVAPFGPNGETELAAVLTPHIGGVVEFYRLEGNELNRVAALSGYTSHQYGSRNLDLAVAGDFDGDGRVELLLPDRSMSRLAGIRRTATKAKEAYSVPLGGTMTTNPATAMLPDGRMVVGVGKKDGMLRLWLQK
jgi:hypothetical protein